MKKENIVKYLSRILCLLVVASMTACGDDDDDDDNNDDAEPMTEVDELVNTYTFTSATFSSAVTVVVTNPTDGAAVPRTFAEGDDAVLFVGDAIVGSAMCDEGIQVGIELREDGTAFLVCDGAGTEVQQGTWIVNADRSLFTLTVTTLEAGFAVVLPGFILENGVLTGTATIPVPYDASVNPATQESIVATGDPLPQSSVDLLVAGGVTGVEEGTLNFQTVDMEIKFTVANF